MLAECVNQSVWKGKRNGLVLGEPFWIVDNIPLGPSGNHDALSLTSGQNFVQCVQPLDAFKHHDEQVLANSERTEPVTLGRENPSASSNRGMCRFVQGGCLYRLTVCLACVHDLDSMSEFWSAEHTAGSVHRVVIPHMDRNDLAVLDQQFQRDAVTEVDGHRVQALQLARESMQSQ